MNNKIKIIILSLLVIIIISAVIFTIINKNDYEIKPENNNKTTIEIKKPSRICYYRSDLTSSGFYDKAWLKLNIIDEKVTGEFYNIPAQSDSKFGTFEGTIGSLNQNKTGNIANVLWNSRSEGMDTKEELDIQFGEGVATVAFGEMIDRGDGVFIYKNKNNHYYVKPMSEFDCEYLDEKLFIEKYIKENFQTIVTNKAVLGGTWYIVYININPSTKTGEVTYEDGHIQSKANLIYTYEKNPDKIVITKFEIIK